MLEQVVIEKLVHGGQGLGMLPDGRKVFVWNALPNEVVRVRLIKNKKDYAEGVAEEIIKPSPERMPAREENYLSTSPWQIMTFAAENRYKRQIIQEIFDREHVDLPNFSFKASAKEYGYRNKMEYSFWGDDDGLHLALHRRGSGSKQIVKGSALAISVVDEAANAVLIQLRKLAVRAGDLKSLVVRCSQGGEAVASLFTKRDGFPQISLPGDVKGLRVYYSDPKSPASVQTKLLYELGDATLTDTILDRALRYDVDSFFQVNLPIFERALEYIAQYISDIPVTDMYGGVGSIGLSIGKDPIIVELDDATAKMAQVNATAKDMHVVHASTEKALRYIVADRVLIVDPPRAGLHKEVVKRILEVKPEQVIYLSCNPVTQARDVTLLGGQYTISYFEGYNFFPRTPHLETVAILQQKQLLQTGTIEP